MDTGTVDAFNTGSINRDKRSISSSAVNGVQPGRVDSTPKSMISAPSSIICVTWAAAASGVLNLPPSEKESGVPFSIPIIRVRSHKDKLLPSFHV